jgi:hypothetical protein
MVFRSLIGDSGQLTSQVAPELISGQVARALTLDGGDHLALHPTS